MFQKNVLIALISLFLLKCPLVAQTIISVNATAQYTDKYYPSGCDIWPIWGRFNVWDITMVPDKASNPSYEFMEEAILMTSSGGRPATLRDASGNPTNGALGDNEMYDVNGNHQFTLKLKPAIDRLLSNGVKPILVIGNTPIPLSSRQPQNPPWITDPEMGYVVATGVPGFNAVVGEPTFGRGYDGVNGYVSYINALFVFLKSNYGSASIPLKTWEFRLMTEPDNNSWWDPNIAKKPADVVNRSKYETLYEKTYQAIQSALGTTDTHLNFGNFVLPIFTQGTSSAWPYLLTTQIPTSMKINSYSYSLYATLKFQYLGGTQMSNDPRDLYGFFNGPAGLRTKTSANFPNAKMNIDEFGLYEDENGKTNDNNVSDATNLGAAWLAATFKKGYDNNLNRNALWTGMIERNNVKPPIYNSLKVFSRLKGSRRLTIDYNPLSGFPYVDAIAGKYGSRTMVLVFSYLPNRLATSYSPVNLTVKNLAANTSFRVKEYRIDGSTSNYLPSFYSDMGGSGNLRSHLLDQNASQWGLNMIGKCDAASRTSWDNNTVKYLQNGALAVLDTRIMKSDASGTIVRTVNMPANSVSLFEVYQDACVSSSSSL